MEPWLVMLLLFQAVWNDVLGKTHDLHKRGLLELSGAIKCGTRRFPLAYLGYGCYCGPGGRGWPKDETDWKENLKARNKTRRRDPQGGVNKHTRLQ
ncbi:phospholipase A2-like isoform X4 [Rhineura floridana]|uniref:phospholipase A2-like isoform X4 n=1 Tax=Rhineura floridana TaxID=261503 RepID=UPI002AC82D41|nr:phospholipase A2-like isoform X4 [Rhineura floridana]